MFHADPHPSNLILLDGGTLAYVDFGMVGCLDEKTWEQEYKLRLFLAAGMIHAAYESLLDSLAPLPRTDISSFESEIKRLLHNYITASKTPSTALVEKSSGYLLLRIFDGMRRAGLQLPVATVRLYRSLIITDMVMLKLYPEIDWLADLRSYLEDEALKQLARLYSSERALITVTSFAMLLANAGQIAGDFLDRAQSRLSGIGRTYRYEIRPIELAFLNLIQTCRAGALGAAILVLSSRFFPQYHFLAAVHQRVGDAWPVFAAAGLIGYVALGRFVRRLRRLFS